VKSKSLLMIQLQTIIKNYKLTVLLFSIVTSCSAGNSKVEEFTSCLLTDNTVNTSKLDSCLADEQILKVHESSAFNKELFKGIESQDTSSVLLAMAIYLKGRNFPSYRQELANALQKIVIEFPSLYLYALTTLPYSQALESLVCVPYTTSENANEYLNELRQKQKTFQQIKNWEFQNIVDNILLAIEDCIAKTFPGED